jgi:Fe-S cluster assembly protein SufD
VTVDPRGRYLELFQATPPPAGPAWLRDLRTGAMDQFAATGFPSTKQEDWRFTSVAAIAETPFVPARAGGAAGARGLGGPDAAPFVEGDGAAAPGPGVRVESLRAALEASPELVRAHLGQVARTDASPFTALNTAFLDDGVFVYVPSGVALDRPIELVFAAGSTGAPTVRHPRVLVVVEPGARATVVERYVALDGGVAWTNAVTEVVLGSDASLEYYRVQEEGARAFQVATTATRQGAASSLRFHPLAFGAGLARHDIRAELAGRGAELVLNGLYVLGGRQHADHHTVIDHQQPDCASHEYFNGLLAEQARGVFNGRIIVRPGAQRTDSKQTNNNLLLSTDARADSQPQLEIYADDVKCTHGSTVGPLDEAAVFYLRSRGLDPEQATAMLTYGFAGEILERMTHPGLRSACDALIRARLGRAQAN